MITTYGVFGKIEYVIGLKIGQTSMNVTFEGGSMNNRGVTPARYKTNSPVVQRAIEASHEYRIGIIKKISSTPEQSDMIAARKIAAAKAAAERKAKEEAERKAQEEAEEAAKAAEEAAKGAVQSDVKNDEDGEQKEIENADAGTEADKEPEGEPKSEEESGASADGKTEVPVTCIEDAVEYLKKNHNYKSADLRSKVSVERAATQHGIVFVGL